MSAREPREDHRIAAQDVVDPVVGRAEVEQPVDRLLLELRRLRGMYAGGPARRDPGAHDGSSSATHSTCCVIGNRSNARSCFSAYPLAANVATSRASDAGSHATYATARGRSATIRRTTPAPAPLRGGSSTTRSQRLRP